MEEIALMALPRDYLDDLEDMSVISRNGSIETSLLPAYTGLTQHSSLPGLSAIGSSRSLNSVSNSGDEGQISGFMRIMIPDPDGTLEPINLPPLRRPDQDPVLECPFAFLKCFR